MARKRFEFWLNDQRQEDWLIYELIGKLKKPTRGQGQFTCAIREGLRLWVSLRDHKIDVLLELFPWVSDAIRQAQPMTDDNKLQREIADLKRLILQQGSISAPPKDYPKMKPSVMPTLPVAEIKQATAVSADAIADNFLSMFQ